MKKILVRQTAFITGATGFLGAHVVRAFLNAGYEVAASVRRSTDIWRLKRIREKIHLVEFDLLQVKSVTKSLSVVRPNIVVNCAAYGVDYRQQDTLIAIETNIKGTHELVYASAKHGVQRFLQIGTCFEYGDKDHPIKENEILEPTSVYGSTKAAGSILALQEARSCDLPLMVLRPFSMWGPLEGRHKLIPQVVNACFKKKPLHLTKGEQVRDYSYVGDVADAIVFVAASEPFFKGEIVNVGSGLPVTVREFVAKCSRYLEGENFMNFGAIDYRRNEMWRLVADNSKWTRLFNCDITKTSLMEGLRKMVGRRIA